MGTNFYFLDGTHAGKRSAAGLYCFDCDITLHKLDKDKVHYCCSHTDPMCDCEWYDACPKCGAKPLKESLNNDSAGRELGFNKKPFKRKTGVASCSSFTWAMDPIAFFSKRAKYIKDEYGTKMTLQEFKDMLKECPIQYNNMVGQEFF